MFGNKKKLFFDFIFNNKKYNVFIKYILIVFVVFTYFLVTILINYYTII